MNLKSVVALSLVGLASLANAETKAQWQACYNRVSHAMISKDFKAFLSFVADDYVYVLPDGKTLNHKQAIANFAQVLKSKSIAGGEKVTSLKMEGKTAVVGFDAHWTTVNAAGRKSHSHETGLDYWRKSNGAWKCFKTVDTPAK